ncbi:DUF1534 domain-containing protein [Pseudomonas syringae]|nr:DUF1534 domain-containing protein [Pseudomonas syringae]MCF5241131.1 DUF1534 domain-containing protein [Pseudomonas syringae]
MVSFLRRFYGGLIDHRANAPRWHASRDALRHKSELQRALKIGRRASRTAYRRRASAR